MKKKIDNPIKKEDGFVLVLALVMLVVLSLLGIAGTSNTIIEIMVATNERTVDQQFKAADSGWKQSGPFLNSQARAPNFVNLTPQNPGAVDWQQQYHRIVRNFGNGGDGATNEDFVAAPDGTIGSVLTQSQAQYWYRVVNIGNRAEVGAGANFRRFNYDIEASVAGVAEVHTIVERVFQIR